MSLTEVLVTTVIIGVISAAIGEIMALCAYASVKLGGLTDVRIGARTALERIKRDIRNSNSIDVTSKSDRLKLKITKVWLADKNDPAKPDYDAGAAWDSLNGTPSGIGEEVEYYVERDFARPGEFFLKCDRRAEGRSVLGQTIAKGIIGPLDMTSGDDVPDVFVYLRRTTNGGTKTTIDEAAASKECHGVAVDLEILRPRNDEAPSTTNTDQRLVSTLAIRGEAFLKCPGKGGTLGND